MERFEGKVDSIYSLVEMGSSRGIAKCFLEFPTF